MATFKLIGLLSLVFLSGAVAGVNLLHYRWDGLAEITGYEFGWGKIVVATFFGTMFGALATVTAGDMAVEKHIAAVWAARRADRRTDVD